MTFVHRDTAAVVDSTVDIFSVPNTNITNEKTIYEHHYPQTAVGSGPLDFYIKPSPYYTCLSDTRLYLKCRIIRSNGELLANDAEPVFLAPMLGHALFSRIEVYVSNKLVTPAHNYYPWKAAIETMLNFSDDAKKTHLACLHYNGGPSNFDDEKSKLLTSSSQAFELMIPLHIDLFFQTKHMLNFTPLRIVLHRTEPSFYLKTLHPNLAPKLEIL